VTKIFQKAVLKDLSLRKILAFAFGLTSVGAVLLLTILHTYSTYKSSQTNIHEDLSKTSKIVAAQVDGHVGEILSAFLAGVATQAGDIFSAQENSRHSALTKILASHPGIRGVWTIHKNGKIMDMMSRFEIVTDENKSQLWKPSMSDGKQIEKIQFSKLSFTKRSDEPLIYAAVPVIRGGEELGGSVVASISLKYLWDVLANIKLEKSGSAFAFDKEGRALGHSDISRLFASNILPQNILTDFFDKDDSSSKEYITSDNREVISGFSLMRDLKFGIAIETPKSNAFEAIWDEIIRSLIVSVVIALASIFIGLYLAHKLIDPLKQLSDAAEEMSNTNLPTTVDIVGTQETQKLGIVFNNMTRRLSATISELKSQIVTRKKAEQQLRESEEGFAKAFEASPAAIAISKKKGGQHYNVNTTWLTLLEYSKKEVIGKNARELNVYKNWQDYLNFAEELSAQGNVRNFECVFLTKNTRELDVVLSGEIIEIGGEEHILVTIHDITERKRAEQKLQKLSQAVEQSPATVVITDEKGKIEYVNPKFEETTGYSASEAYGKNPRILSSGETSQEQYKKLWDTITSGNVWQGEFHNVRKDGTFYWEAASISAIRNSIGEITNYLAVKEDITGNKDLEEQVRRSQKLEAIGQLTGGIAHDFNNILGIILGNLELLELMLSGNDKAKKRIDQALKGAKRGADITRKLLSFSRQTAHQVSLTSVNTFIENIEELIAKSLTATIKVETHLAENLWSVETDTGDFEDSILNLSLNAKDAMPNGGTLVIETANKTLDEEYVKCNPGSSAGDFVMISVSDTGIGMNKEVREKVFEPFFTTKETGKGTGLGLSMVHGFIQRSGGHIKIYSEEHKGTTFRIFLPRAQCDNDSIKTIDYAHTSLPRGNEKILIVDDEEGLLDIAAACLEELGYETMTATSGQQAIDILSTNKNFDLLFSDIIMPGDIDGYQLAISVNKSKPSLKILLATGFTKKREEYLKGESKFLTDLVSNLLSKPYNKSELALAVRRTLDENT